jgi:hypothetical protein
MYAKMIYAYIGFYHEVPIIIMKKRQVEVKISFMKNASFKSKMMMSRLTCNCKR